MIFFRKTISRFCFAKQRKEGIVELTFIVQAEEDATRLNLFLRRRSLSASLIKSIKYTEGGLRVNNEPAKTNRVVNAGDIVQAVLPQEPQAQLEPEDIPLEILYEDTHVLAVNKPAGLVTHPTRTHKEGTLGNAFCGLMQKRGKPQVFRPVGRLDAGTSGVALCALNAYAAPIVAAHLQKAYLALVGGQLAREEGQICQPIGPAEDSVIRQRVVQGGRPSTTLYKVVQCSKMASLVLVQPLTGRTHQIRVHFAWQGHPLLGDTLYGGETSLIGRHALHCGAVSFLQPAGARRLVDVPPPDFIQAAQEAEIQPDWETLQQEVRSFACREATKLV